MKKIDKIIFTGQMLKKEVKSSEDDLVKEAPKTSTKKACSKKVSSKSEHAKESTSEEKSE